MATPNMATITASLERSLQNCSLNHQQSSSSSSSSSSTAAQPQHGSDSPPHATEAATPTLELNSQGSLPFHWEQCLDLKTGEIYYINWRTGMKATEDPRTTAEYGGGYYSDDDVSSYDSTEGSSSESSPSSSREQWRSGNINNNINNIQENCYDYQAKNENDENNNNNSNNVLVVAGCKSCLMYYMVPKQLEICPKCCGQLLHFDRSENGSS